LGHQKIANRLFTLKFLEKIFFSCNCPGGGACIYLDKQLICTECPEGYTGPRCEYCSEDYFGHPLFGKPCQKCDCNGNVDPNNIRQCVRRI